MTYAAQTNHRADYAHDAWIDESRIAEKIEARMPMDQTNTAYELAEILQKFQTSMLADNKAAEAELIRWAWKLRKDIDSDFEDEFDAEVSA